MNNNLLMIFMFLFIFVSFANADYLNTENNHCVYELAPYPEQKGYCWIDRHDSINYCDKKSDLDQFVNGFYYENGVCLLNDSSHESGISSSDWNYQMALLANFFGFTFLFLTNYLVFRVGS